MLGFGDTHKGQVRKINQDYIYVTNEKIGNLDNLYLVADGIGGHNAGEIASSVAIDTYKNFVKNATEKEVLEILVSAMTRSNEEVFKMSKETKDYKNMGTTLLSASIKNNKIFIAHVGDCRLYGIRNGKIAQMTADHTYAMDLFKAGILSREEAKLSKDSRILTRAIGTDANIQADALFCDVFRDDIFLLCSDGLTDMVSDKEILDICINANLSPKEKVQSLINKANENGGKDNIAIVVIES